MTDEEAPDRTVADQLQRLVGSGWPKLTSSVAIVTGAGTHHDGPIGTGAAMCHLFAAHGAHVLVVDRHADRGGRTCALVESRGHEALFFEGDVSDEALCCEAVGAALSAWGRVDVLVNNAGVSQPTPLEELSVEAWDAAYRGNVTSAFLMTKAVAPHLEHARGSIINVSSIAAVRTFGYVAYATSKAALVTLTRETAYALGPRGIRANCILPGHMYAPMSGSLGDEARESRRRSNLLGIEGTAWDVAATALFLASTDARWITGTAIPVDGGTINTTSYALQGLHVEPPLR
jgi:NAD(P)-dependent dehydrogenase (short-subunit alcohol dehydrogenase family)